VARDDDLMTGLQVEFGNGLADEARSARDDDVHIIRGAGGAAK
jgi:hypothetical protein